MSLRTIAADSNQDLFLGSDGMLALVDDLPAVAQIARQASLSQLGEMVLRVDDGMPNYTTVWNGPPQITPFTAALRRTLLAVTDVVDVTSIEVTISGEVLSYTATIATTYGSANLNG